MKIVYFAHSLVSCWNHGNAHFLRGVLRELLARGHDVTSFEPPDSWSRTNLVREQGEAGVREFARCFPDLAPHARFHASDIDAMLGDADLVVVHEWNEPSLIAAIGQRRAQGGRFRLLFHDTHHRAVSDPEAIFRRDLSAYDGVLAFGEALAEVYRKAGWGGRVFTWHEAADTRLFRPPAKSEPRSGAAWIGNWGDEERSAELQDFLLRPAASAGVALDAYGVRYPQSALDALRPTGARYRGWLANGRVPEVFARHCFTVHVPRRFYATQLPGIPTIRVFEALACGIPLISAPWHDTEALFRAGEDYLSVSTPEQTEQAMRMLLADEAQAGELAAHGVQTILSRHTCAHRVDELLAIAARLGAPQPLEIA
jgi:spore maturation protein CgeB